jgi:two-component system sensor histidine kinase DctS
MPKPHDAGRFDARQSAHDGAPHGARHATGLGAMAAPAGSLRRWLLWSTLVGLLVVGQTLLVALTLRYEDSRAMERAEGVAASAAQDVRRLAMQRLQAIQGLRWSAPSSEWTARGRALLARTPEVARLERRDAQGRLISAVDSPLDQPLFGLKSREVLRLDSDQACAAALSTLSPQFSRSYFVPMPGGAGLEVVDACLPEQEAGQVSGYSVATLPLAYLLEAVAPKDNRYEITFIEADGARLARHGATRGLGLYVARRPLDLPGVVLELKVNDTLGRPGLLPNVTTALVLSLSIALAVVVVLLLRDMRRRSAAEQALAESLAFRKAMEDSLNTGLRARDLDGRITYVNPAFCSMVGFSAAQLIGSGGLNAPLPPYWPPERVEEYSRRQSTRRIPPPGMGAGGASADSAGSAGSAASMVAAAELSSPSAEGLPATLQGFETVFMRANGERFPVMIYEAPLVDGEGRQTGWMSAVLDVSERQRNEEVSRQQQERLQATARLATMGEMASLLSHELNQPLAAIASYASGCQNLLQSPDEHTLPMLREAVTRMGEQAERAGRVIKSVHDFVRRREQLREAIPVRALLEGVLPLVRLQARKSGTRVEVHEDPPGLTVQVDRTMLEQVLLNLTRNGIQAMEPDTPLAERVLELRVSRTESARVQFEVHDRGPGIPPDVAARLFTPFFTTRADGMGLGLSLCRTVVEQHGGTLEHDVPEPGTPRPGCCFRFTVPRAGG